ncbi:hypothetical protein A2Y99_02060 [Candidatus Gottesmanbacteria bacterium RBG_13_37_7]|uniref:Methionine--tRNA ligase n=1 Tax=Candidatus Gottesmanbacteria bacterium RBG_13_37_7 TaxID=1798369 RepID=A0A1F5YI40_9BACT|nr:MAG: hypothetical protein A2Y99_02060 [Candidatus Gottesmanbacteria bacterium RBG_13_37_7]
MKSAISYSDFQKLDLRVGKILEAEMLKSSVNLIKVRVDFGKDYGEKTILTGIAKWYKPEDLKDKKFIFVVNLEPKKMMDETSEGMILCADINGKAKLIPVNKSIPEGTLVR